MVKTLLWVLTVLSNWLEFFVEDIFHIVQSRTLLYLCTFLASKIGLEAKIEFHIVQSRTLLYLCTFLASKIGLEAKIEFCLFLDVPYHHVGFLTLLVYAQQVRLVVVVPRLRW